MASHSMIEVRHISRNEVDESQGFVLSPEDPILKSPQIHRLKKQQRSAGSNPELSSKKYSPEMKFSHFCRWRFRYGIRRSTGNFSRIW
jgi:hypothetical protein